MSHDPARNSWMIPSAHVVEGESRNKEEEQPLSMNMFDLSSVIPHSGRREHG